MAIDIWHSSVRNAANSIRKNLDISQRVFIDGLFEKEYNCELHVDRDPIKGYAKFKSESDEMWFLLKWTR